MSERFEYAEHLATVIVADPKGVHVRTGQLVFARLRRGGFDASLSLSCARGSVLVPRASSVLPFDVLRLGARFGDEVLVSSTGHDAGEVVRVVREILGSSAPGHGAALTEGLAQALREIGGAR